MKFNFRIQPGIIVVLVIAFLAIACDCDDELDIPLGVYTSTGEGYLTTSGGEKKERSVPELAFSIHLDPDNECTLYGDENGDGVFDDFIESGRYRTGGEGYGFIDLEMPTQAYCQRLWYTRGNDAVMYAETPSLCISKFNGDGSRFNYCYVLQ